MITGQAEFLLLNLAVTMAPLALVMVIWQMNPFWISILASFLLMEPIIMIELVGMIFCFTAVVLITMRTKNGDTDASEVAENEVDAEQVSGANLAFMGLIISFISSIFMAFLAVLSRMLK